MSIQSKELITEFNLQIETITLKGHGSIYQGFSLFFMLGLLNILMVYVWIKNADGFKHPHITNDITCYNKIANDSLLFIEDQLETDRNIFFVETSCRGLLDSRQACAIESAVRASPNRKVFLIFTGPITNITLNTNVFQELRKMNVQFRRIHLEKALIGTPLERIVTKKLLQYSHAKVSHTSDILRFYLLWKFGGIYLDLDVIVLQSFDLLANDFAGRESNFTIASGVMSMSATKIGRRVAQLAVEKLGNDFENRSKYWAGNGPALITEILTGICHADNVYSTNAEKCHGFEVYEPQVFYPVNGSAWMKFYKQGHLNLTNSHTIHTWNKLMTAYQKIVPKNSIYNMLARKYCPKIYKLTTLHHYFS